MDFDRVSDADQRLRNMYGLWNGKYVQITGLDGSDSNIIAFFVEIPSGKKGKDSLSSGNFNFTNFNMGYTLVKEHNKSGGDRDVGVYVHRKPIRTTRQGLDYRNISCDRVSQGYYNLEYLVSRNDLSSMLLGKFEFDKLRSINNAYIEAEEFDERLKFQYPISKNFAVKASIELHGQVLLMRRGEPVGSVLDDKFELSKPFAYCKEELEREGIL